MSIESGGAYTGDTHAGLVVLGGSTANTGTFVGLKSTALTGPTTGFAYGEHTGLAGYTIKDPYRFNHDTFYTLKAVVSTANLGGVDFYVNGAYVGSQLGFYEGSYVGFSCYSVRANFKNISLSGINLPSSPGTYVSTTPDDSNFIIGREIFA
jgi:hypothetical protein